MAIRRFLPTRSLLSIRPTPPLYLSAPRSLHTTSPLSRDGPKPAPGAEDASNENPGAMPDNLAGGSFKGVTGGGEPLDSSAEAAAPKPKISNLSVPGSDKDQKLTKEQEEEVRQHNEDFDKKHDRGSRAPEDKVDKKFWQQGS